MRTRLILFALLGIVLLAVRQRAAVLAGDSDPEEPLETPSQVEITERLTPPAMPAQPQQADYGAYVYYQVCMACHGDHGQGLTDEWRALWEEDSNCWASKCHGPNHPPQGFSFPRKVGAVNGQGTLARFKNGSDLFEYLKTKMPWWNPGYLTENEYWQLTAYLLRTHQALPGTVDRVDVGNAAIFRLRSPAPYPPDVRPAGLLAAFVLAAAALLGLVRYRLHR